MNNFRVFVLVLAACLMALAACTPAPTPAPVVEPVAEPTIVSPTQEPPAPPPAEPTVPQYAPFCQTAPACEAPIVEMRDNAFCVEKIPYAIMAAPAGTTYESQNADMTCQDQATADGSLRITCTGDELISYDLKVCNGSCTAPALVMDSPQCPAGYGLDSAQQCCAQPAAADSGCTIFRVDIGACPSD